MDMKLLEEGIINEGKNDLTLEAYASIASRSRRREAFYRALTVSFACAVLFAAAAAYFTAIAIKSGKTLPAALLFEGPGTVRAMLERFFILACVPAACFVSAYTGMCRAVCTVCPCLCGCLCGSALCRAASSFCTLTAVNIALFTVLALTVSVYSAVCVGFRVCRVRYGVTQEDKDALFGFLMSAMFILLVFCAFTLLVPELTGLFIP